MLKAFAASRAEDAVWRARSTALTASRLKLDTALRAKHSVSWVFTATPCASDQLVSSIQPRSVWSISGEGMSTPSITHRLLSVPPFEMGFADLGVGDRVGWGRAGRSCYGVVEESSLTKI